MCSRRSLFGEYISWCCIAWRYIAGLAGVKRLLLLRMIILRSLVAHAQIGTFLVYNFSSSKCGMHENVTLVVVTNIQEFQIIV